MKRFNPTYEDEKRWLHNSKWEFGGYLMGETKDKWIIEVSCVSHTLGMMPESWIGQEIVFPKSEVSEIHE